MGGPYPLPRRRGCHGPPWVPSWGKRLPCCSTGTLALGAMGAMGVGCSSNGWAPNAQHKRNRFRNTFLPWVPPRPMAPPLLGGEIHSREARGGEISTWVFPRCPPRMAPPPNLGARLRSTLKVLGVTLLVVNIGKKCLVIF